MTDQDTIRAAVELADGWEVADSDHIRGPVHPTTWLIVPDGIPQYVLDALAAQLVRQVNALEEFAIHIEPGKTILCGVTYTDKGFKSHHTIDVCEGEDPTENTTKVIVDSKVLK